MNKKLLLGSFIGIGTIILIPAIVVPIFINKNKNKNQLIDDLKKINENDIKNYDGIEVDKSLLPSEFAIKMKTEKKFKFKELLIHKIANIPNIKINLKKDLFSDDANGTLSYEVSIVNGNKTINVFSIKYENFSTIGEKILELNHKIANYGSMMKPIILKSNNEIEKGDDPKLINFIYEELNLKNKFEKSLIQLSNESKEQNIKPGIITSLELIILNQKKHVIYLYKLRSVELEIKDIIEKEIKDSQRKIVLSNDINNNKLMKDLKEVFVDNIKKIIININDSYYDYASLLKNWDFTFDMSEKINNKKIEDHKLSENSITIGKLILKNKIRNKTMEFLKNDHRFTFQLKNYLDQMNDILKYNLKKTDKIITIPKISNGNKKLDQLKSSIIAGIRNVIKKHESNLYDYDEWFKNVNFKIEFIDKDATLTTNAISIKKVTLEDKTSKKVIIDENFKVQLEA